MVRFSEEDLRIINSVAKKSNMWAATWVREAVLEKLVRLGKKKDVVSNIREYGR